MLALSRRVPRAVLRPVMATRSITWEALGRKLEFDPETKAQYNSWKNAVDAVENDLARWSKPVAPINWENYEANIDAPGFVEFLKERYESMDWAAVDAKLPKTDFAKLEAEKAAALKNAEEVKAQAEKALVELKARLELAVNNRINRDSSCEDVWAKYPKIKEEVYAELENHEWFKDTR